jgi:hypothetical protein
VSDDEQDRAEWLAASRQGRHLFIEERVSRIGAVLGIALAAWNALIGGSLGEYDANRLVLESAYYLGGSMVLSGFAAMLEWYSLHRRFGH